MQTTARSRFVTLRILLVVSMALAFGLQGRPEAAPQYSIVPIGGLGEWHIPASINQHSQIAGYGPKGPFVYSKGVLRIFANVHVSAFLIAAGINDRGTLAGIIHRRDGVYNSFIYQLEHNHHPLDFSRAEIIPIDGLSLAQMNSRGTAIGVLWGENPEMTAVAYEHGSLTRLPGLRPGDDTFAAQINNQGQIIGYSNDSHGLGAERAVLWQNGQVTALELLPGYSMSAGQSINDSGVAIGVAFSPDSSGHGRSVVGWIYRDGTMTQLPSPNDVTTFVPFRINNRNQIVIYGEQYDPALRRRFWLYSDDILYDLETLIPTNSNWVLDGITDMNDRGEIVGYGYTIRDDGIWEGQRGFLMTPHRSK